MINGITLIALVVTIVVLLILAGITISLVFGPNGVVKKAQEAANKTNEAIINEQAQMNGVTSTIENMLNGIGGGSTTPEEPLPEGAVQFSPVEWENGKASTIITTSEEGYTLQYQIEGISEENWTDTTSGYEITGLTLGQTVYGRLFNGTEGSKTADITVEDLIKPSAQISLSGTSVETTGSITATVTFTDNESGLNITGSKWVYNTNAGAIGEDESSYTNSFTNNNNPQTITLSTTTAGTYYLHVLTVDNAGNKAETISDAITVIQLATSISVTPTSLTLEEGETKKLTATVIPTTANDKSVIWSSNNTNVASVSSSGLLTAKSAGNTTITVTTADGSKKTATCNVIVEPALPTIEELLTEGKYVSYVDKSEITRKCIVLYNTSSYGVQIITEDIVENVEIGNGTGSGSDNKEDAYFNLMIDSYNNAISTLNTRAKAYLNPTFASDARCVGSVPNNKNSQSGYHSTEFGGTYDGKLRDTDNNYTTDWNKMGALGIRKSNDNYWLASRNVTSFSDRNRSSRFEVRYVFTDGALESMAIGYAYELYNQVCSYSRDLGLRPVFHLKPGIKVTGGNGTSSSPYTLEI